MTFDFFNPSHLAFGTKLTRAFNQLNNLCIDAEDNMQDLFRIYDIYKQYVNRNYPCPMPTRGDAPCRTNELFDLINDENTIKSFYITAEGKFHCALNIFRRVANRFTRAEGETDLKEGYAFCKSSISNSQPEREIQFTDTYTQGEGNFLFSFRIDSDNNINISENAYSYFLPSNFDHITGMTYEDEIHPDYTAKDYEAVLLIGWSSMDNNRPYGDVNSKLEVYLNGQEIEKVSGWLCRQFMVVYLKPEDKLTGSWSTGFRIKYTKNPVPIPTVTSLELYEGPKENVDLNSWYTLMTPEYKKSDEYIANILNTGKFVTKARFSSGYFIYPIVFKLANPSNGTISLKCNIGPVDIADGQTSGSYNETGIYVAKSANTSIAPVYLAGRAQHNTMVEVDTLIPEGYDIIIFLGQMRGYYLAPSSAINLNLVVSSFKLSSNPAPNPA